MFNNKEKKTEPIKEKAMDRNVVAKNTTIKGDINSDGDFRIDGTLEGTLKTNGRVIIGKDGSIIGGVEAANADIEGKFSGQLQISNMLTVKAPANISGEVTTGKLSIEPGATFNSTCTMKGAVKELNQKNGDQKRSGKTA